MRQVKEQQRLMPVIPIIVYHGRTRWKVRSMTDYFTDGQPLTRFLPSFDYLLFDLSVIESGNLRLLKTGYGQLTAQLLKTFGINRR